MNEKTLRMGTHPLLPLIISMSLPSMFSMLIQALYNIVDSIFVSKLGEDALSAVSIVYPIQMIFISVAVGTSVGLSSLISRRLGAQDYEAAQSAAEHSILLGTLHWSVFLIFGIFFSRPFAMAFSDDPALVDPAAAYCSVVCIGSFFMLNCSSFEKIMQAGGDMISPMWVMLSGAITNIILDPIMIFGYFGCPAMGVKGAAIATVIGQFVSFALANVLMNLKPRPVKVRWAKFKIDSNIIRDIYQVGLPSMIMQSIGSVLTLCLNAILIGFSTTAVAIYGVYFKLQSFVFMPVFGMNHGLLPIMGYNYGARNRKRLMTAFKYGLIIALIIMCTGCVIFHVFPAQLMALFNAEGDMLTHGVTALKTISLCFPLAAIGIIIGTLFQATARGFYSVIVSVLRQLVLIVPMAYCFSRIWGVPGVWYAFAAAELGSLVCSAVLLSRLWKTDISKMPEGETRV